MPPRVPRFARVLLFPAFAMVVVIAVHVVVDLGGSATDALVERWLYCVVCVLCSAVCLWRAVSVARQRLAWGLIGMGLLAWSAGNLVYFGIAARSGNGLVVAEILWICLYPPIYVAVGLMARERLRGLGVGLWLDGIALALALGALANVLLIDRVVSDVAGFSSLDTARALVFPLGDTTLIVMIAGVLTLLSWRVSRTWSLLGAGFVTFGLADAVFAARSAAGNYEPGSITDLGWFAGAMLVAAAASLPDEPVARVRIVAGTWALAVPVIAGACLTGLLVEMAIRSGNLASAVLAGLGLAVVLARTAITLVQNQRLLRASRTEAATDALTRLGNRRRLMEDLEDALAHPDAGHTVLALFDLDGFKAYNDAFGHPAGDALLARIARALQGALGESGSAYRMGGDEFCALLPADHQGDGQSRVGRLAAAMRQHGEGFDVTASSGLALLGAGTDASNALAEADRQLYAAKHSTRRTARDQTADALVAVTQARHPELRAHADHVRDVASAVARELAMPEHEVADIREAARLHDIGKMAIPDAVLGKQGPLDGDEWKFMRRHTVIGERILTSAPALHSAARIVRSSHERWDGTGYPDGLAGSDIPLGARVIFACHAYDAMTSDRPYQAARESAVALAELRSCAGSQFDPEVVEALARVLATGAGAARVAA